MFLDSNMFVIKKRTCLEIYCLISSSLILEPFDFTTNATGTSPAASSFKLKQIKGRYYLLALKHFNQKKKFLFLFLDE